MIDRGPYGRRRIIDLSWAAAKRIGMIGRGIATVKVDVLQNPIPFRPTDNLNLPNMDFEVSEAGYSFIEHWKKIKTIPKEKDVHKKPRDPHSVSEEPSSKCQIEEKMVIKQRDNSPLNKDVKKEARKPVKKNNTFKKPKESFHKGTPNRWSKAFEN